MQSFHTLPTHRQYSIALLALAAILLAIGLASLSESSNAGSLSSVTQGPAVPRAAAETPEQHYSFTQGSLITEPAADFCEHFTCIANFWNGRGYVVECQDGMFSLSGGMREACSYHGGVMRTLYAH